MSFVNLINNFVTPSPFLAQPQNQCARGYVALLGCVMIVASVAMRQMGTASTGMSLLYAGCGVSVITGSATRIPALIAVPFVLFSGISTATNPWNSQMFSRFPTFHQHIPLPGGGFIMIPGFGF
jgi:uncharacterized membrane protein YphA (DoxX/SURF4 family)